MVFEPTTIINPTFSLNQNTKCSITFITHIVDSSVADAARPAPFGLGLRAFLRTISEMDWSVGMANRGWHLWGHLAYMLVLVLRCSSHRIDVGCCDENRKFGCQK